MLNQAGDICEDCRSDLEAVLLSWNVQEVSHALRFHESGSVIVEFVCCVGRRN